MDGSGSFAPLRFLHLATTLRGGAGIAAVRLHDALREAGHASHIFTHEDAGARDDARSFETVRSKASNALSKAWYKLTTREKYYYRDDGWCLPGVEPLLAAARGYSPDVIIAHFLTGFLDFAAVARLREATGAPVIFYLMDMAPMTGGCHFAWDCRGYETGCGNCPALQFGGLGEGAASVVARKRSALSGIPHVVVTGARRLSGQAGSSAVFAGSAVHTIPLAIDDKLFAPRDRLELRRKFGLEGERTVLFFASRAREQERKGLPVLKHALQALAERMPAAELPQLLVAGDGPDFLELSSLGYPVRSLGPVGLAELAECYAVADAFVSPSVEDSGPMMINEAVMSGTPIVAFDTGVVSDFIIDGSTGFVAECMGDPSSLAGAIVALVNVPRAERAHAREQLRKIGLAKMTAARQAQAFEVLANDLVDLHGKVTRSGER